MSPTILHFCSKTHRIQEKHLVTLRKQQREKVEEIKKKTNFYSTKNLIERYDAPATMAPRPRGATPQAQPQGAQPTPQRAAPGKVNGAPRAGSGATMAYTVPEFCVTVPRLSVGKVSVCYLWSARWSLTSNIRSAHDEVGS